jgi:hypothetical protein
MAYLRKRPRSPYLFLRYRDLETGAWREKSTQLRYDDPKQKRAALRICQKTTEKEAAYAPTNDGEFSGWVASYLADHYGNPRSFKRYEAAWLRICDFLREKNIRHPRQIRYDHANDFMQWRKKQGASHNTARLELKFMSFLMAEALRRDYAEKNPLALAKVERTPAAQKPELDEKLLRAARAAFEKRPLWMRNIFEICAHIGCRFSEAAMPLSQVDFKRKIIWIEDSKRPPGDPRKMYSVPMPKSLVDYLKTIRKHPRTAPPVTGDMNRVFNIVLKKATGATSHSLRVSFISRCHRAGLSEMQAMRLVNHSSQLVHRIYSRLSAEDARAAMSKVTPPPLP